jgi:hypothetical protein
VDETYWLECSEPAQMLEYLESRVDGRKWRLFACAALRQAWHHFIDERSQQAVQTAECYAEGLATREELDRAREAALEVVEGINLRATVSDAGWSASRAAVYVCDPRPVTAARISNMLTIISAAPWGEDQASVEARGEPEDKAIAKLLACDLVREIFGNPFRPVAIEPAWLRWNGGTVPVMAHILAAERRYREMPILADALEEAGCTEESLLAHCRQAADHVPGCWVLDALLQARPR